MSIDEQQVRTIIFTSLFLVITLLEFVIPRRQRRPSIRNLSNILIFVLDIVCVRLVFPAASVGIALYAQKNGIGLLNYFNAKGDFWIVVSIIVFDFFIYFQHLISHRFNILWRLHRVHHSDTEFDFTTALRFHPLEILLSMAYKSIIIMVFGFSTFSVLVFEIILNSTAIFNHANINISKKWDLLIRKVIVTPDMHRIHHSTINKEMNSNYGFSISLWDRIFSTYTHRPELGHIKMNIGLKQFRDKNDQSLLSLIMQPFK